MPRLRLDFNTGTLDQKSDWTTAPRGSTEQIYEAIKSAGYEGIQGGDPELCRKLGLRYTSGARVNRVGEIEPIAKKHQDEGNDLTTLHVAWGFESDDEVDRLVVDILNASHKLNYPLYIETHRATITNDPWRTLQMVKRHPTIELNGDFSHWYTGAEMPYGDFNHKLDLLQPVFDRVRFIHGRIGNSSHMQVKVDELSKPQTNVDHFKQIWTRAFQGFLKSAKADDFICFTPEILAGNYARVFADASGQLREESDRWQQALLYCEIARECFAKAQSRE